MMRDINDRLLTLQKAYETGNSGALLTAIDVCAASKVVMPDWVSEAYRKKFDAWTDLEYKTLDEAFGVAWPEGKHFVPKQAKLKKGLHPGHVFGWIITQHQTHGTPISDNGLFNDAARFFKSNKTEIKELYKIGKLNAAKS